MLIALAANAAIAIVKGIAGLLSGSAAMLAEAAHSLADTANQGFLLASIHLGARGPDEEHQFGHGKERFFWSFLAAVLIFLAGAVFSIGQGVLELVRERREGSYALVYGTLAFAFVAEGISLVRAVRQTRAEAREAGKDGASTSARAPSRPRRRSSVKTWWAVLGLVIAAVGVALHQVTGEVAWDATAAIVVGVMLIYVAYVLGRNFKDLLIGAGASREEIERIRRILSEHPGVDEVLDVRTMYVGPRSLLVAARLDRRRARCGGDRAAGGRARQEASRGGAGRERGVPRPDPALALRTQLGIYAAGIAATPGRSLPARSSSAAPPPVESHETSPSSPSCRSARAESAPPTTEYASERATASATAFVPSANRGHSKTPIGPFQKIVLARAISAAKASRVAGPMSSPSQPSGSAS